MLVVLNKCYGGFGLSKQAVEALGLEDGYYGDEATDWEMDDYDGIETITYVVDGKLYHA